MEIRAHIVRPAIVMRNVLLTLLEPLDWVSRSINHKTDWPPLVMRRQVGPLDQLESSGAEFKAYIRILGSISPTVRMLDIGCGFGLMAMYLRDYIREPGTYLGIDVNKSLVKWAQQHITPKNNNFKFICLDMQNALYNPKGRLSVESNSLPLADKSFDFVLVKSVFTHLRKDDLQNYLGEIKRILIPGGVCFATFFLMNNCQRELQKKGLNSINFKIFEGPSAYMSSMAEIAIGYDEQLLSDTITDSGLTVEKTYYGTWSGKPDGVSYQDIIVLTNK